MMAVAKNAPVYHVDGRVSIALNALDDKQKEAVANVITNRVRFLASTADRRKVRRISKEESLYALQIPRGLRVIFSQVAGDIVIMDLMRQATLDQFGPKASRAGRGATKRRRAMPDSTKAK